MELPDTYRLVLAVLMAALITTKIIYDISLCFRKQPKEGDHKPWNQMKLLSKVLIGLGLTIWLGGIVVDCLYPRTFGKLLCIITGGGLVIFALLLEKKEKNDF